MAIKIWKCELTKCLNNLVHLSAVHIQVDGGGNNKKLPIIWLKQRLGLSNNHCLNKIVNNLFTSILKTKQSTNYFYHLVCLYDVVIVVIAAATVVFVLFCFVFKALKWRQSKLVWHKVTKSIWFQCTKFIYCLWDKCVMSFISSKLNLFG